MVNIKQLWWRRYRGLFLIVLIAATAFMAIVANGQISSYQSGIQHHGYASRYAYNEDVKNYKQHPKDYSEPIKDFNAWQKDNLQLYKNAQESAEYFGVSKKEASSYVLPAYSNGDVVNVVIIIAALLIGAFAAGWDHLSQFDRFIFGLGVKRQKYYWWRTAGLIGLATVAALISICGYWALLYTKIPSDIVNLSGSTALAIFAYNWLLTVMGILLGQLIGIVIANPVAVGAVSVGSMILGYLGVNHLATLAVTLKLIKNSFQLDTPLGGYWAIMIGAALLTLWALFGGNWAYQRLSLDYPGWLRLRQAFVPTVIAGTILVVSAETFFSDYTGTVKWASQSLMIQAVTLVIVVGIGVWHHRRMTSV
ncbi:hypothetical protein [Lacticaseibacillus porcinae]|uniref:hypothetical protein n=1 Tax=Lacticaseibacillus porcinae TaxID=1123687 RepID=UPI000F7A58A2|nr:hypothetical protein [Lacticaseibacillus porcinae]